MAERSSVFCLERSLLQTKSFEKPLTVNALRKFKRNRWRIPRRKRSKLNYWARRRESRSKRNSEDLCDTISVFDITDMEMEVAQQSQPVYVHPLEEVSAWQNQHQVAYWKSRAIALEYENRMLHKLLENVHKKQIQEYVECIKEQDQDNDEEEMEEVWEYSMQRRPRKFSKKQESNKIAKKRDFWEPPSEQVRKDKQERMDSLYGEMAPKICGMETATQLNYDLYIDRHNPPYWPNIPIKL